MTILNINLKYPSPSDVMVLVLLLAMTLAAMTTLVNVGITTPQQSALIAAVLLTLFFVAIP